MFDPHTREGNTIDHRLFISPNVRISMKVGIVPPEKYIAKRKTAIMVRRIGKYDLEIAYPPSAVTNVESAVPTTVRQIVFPYAVQILSDLNTFSSAEKSHSWGIIWKPIRIDSVYELMLIANT